MHPLGGVDHVLAMVAVGFFATLLGGPALWLVPMAFVAMMSVGGALGMAGVPVPFLEVGIGLSVVALGAAVALHLNMPIAAAMAFVGFLRSSMATCMGPGLSHLSFAELGEEACKESLAQGGAKELTFQ
jgi:hydrogenase/urease accessory protein HupE